VSLKPHERPRLGISACLLGHPVRFDGGHTHDAFLVESLGPFVDWVPLCPEEESGLDSPREALRPVETDELDGFVLKKDSPTCGLERVFPLRPIEEEGRLNDPRLRENFVERIFAYRRLRALFASRWSMGAVVRFHTAQKLTLMAHTPEAYRRLGRLVASGSSMNRREFQDRYSSDFMTALRTIATPRRQINVLQHMLGYFKQHLDRDSRAELLALIQDYGRGHVPLVVPLTLFAHHIRRCGVAYLAGQVYLQPHPAELMLRNRV
jgi:uncharacterized protein YbgA (DUF1722 family)